MKVSLNTATYYANGVNLTPNGVDGVLAAIGAQLGAVEAVEYFGPKYDGVVVAKVVGCEKHPNADKLSVCTIDDGGVVLGVERDDAGHVQVVCGAPNVRTGLLVAWIPPNTSVPATHGTNEPFVLEPKELRGVVSNGMLASAKELGISDNHSGILEINPELEIASESGAQKPSVGMEFKRLYGLDDTVIDLENKMFTHRPDCFGVLGVARELAAIQGQKFTSPEWYQRSVSLPTGAEELALHVHVDDTKSVPRLTAVVMDGLSNGESPIWMQAALSRMGIRPISAIVDITNFVMQLTGQPTHAYDYDKLKSLSGDTPTLMSRFAKKGEVVELLSGKKLTLESETIVIATDKQPIALAGVMGGASTEVDEKTTRIVLECANFDMYSVRRASMKYGVFTDASTRFNKGQSPLQIAAVQKLTMDMLADMCGARRASEVYDVHAELPIPKSVQVSTEFIGIRLGTEFKVEQIKELLERTEFGVVVDGENLQVTPPFWRTDIHLPEDIVEEIGRIYGFATLPITLPRRSGSASIIDPSLAIKTKVRTLLSGAGANELLTYNFVHGNLLDAFGQQREKALQLSNALSPELQYYRMTLLPNVLDKVHANIKAGFSEFAIFELGKAHNNFHLDETDFNLPKEIPLLALVVAADQKAAKQKSGAAYYTAQKYLDYLLTKLGIAYSLQAIEGELPDFPVTKPYDPRRSAYVLDANGEIIGMVGEINAQASARLKLPDFTAGFELDTSRLSELAGSTTYVPSSKYPAIEQDVSLKVPAAVTYGALLQTLQAAITKAAPSDCLHTLQPLDSYRADDTNDKHIAFRLRIASTSRTLTASEVNTLLDTAAVAAAEAFGAVRL